MTVMALFDRWTDGAEKLPLPTDKFSDHLKRNDGTRMLWRLESNSGGVTIDIVVGDGISRKVHLPKRK
ncbi:hypothetical protein [Stackebrandtia soli]|uniref:hypothetical protein n=1 Tax=Stackebrandtia soli TaxID=1892856 RepID=UPI0039EC3F21